MVFRNFQLNGRHGYAWIAVGIPALSALYVWLTVIDPFLRNGVPPGWDTGAYIGWVNSFFLGGFGYVQDPRFIQFSGANLSPLFLLIGTTSLTRVELSGFVMFQLLILVTFFASTLFLSRAWNGSIFYSLLVFGFLITDPGFIRMTWGFYANLLTLGLLQIALALSVIRWNFHSKAAAAGICLFCTLMLVTDVEIGLFGILVLGTSLLLNALKARLDLRATIQLLAPVLGSLVFASILWLPYAGQYLAISPAIAPPSPTVDWSLLESDLGGPLMIPIWLAGVAFSAYQFRRMKENPRSSILLSWFLVFSISIIVTLTFRPTLANRVALLLPAYFLNPEALRLVYSAYGRVRSLGSYAKPIGVILLIAITTGIGVYSTTTFATETSHNASLPYLSRQNYEVLTSTMEYLRLNNINGRSTVFLIYPTERTTDPEAVNAWTNLYDSWIFATVGPHLSYYGTVENFTTHSSMTFISSNEQETFRTYSDIFGSQHPQAKLSLVVISFLYRNNTDFQDFSQPIPGVYITELTHGPNGYIES